MALSWFKRFTKPQPDSPADSVTDNSSAESVAGSPVVEEDVVPAEVREEWLAPPPRPRAAAIEIPAEKIAQRAYEKWIQRGRTDGSPDQDWLAAEAELRAEYATATAEPLPHRSR